MKNIAQKKVLITGADGFIGKNLCVRLSEEKNFEVIKFVRGDNDIKLSDDIKQSDFIIHLAGENRPENEKDFNINSDLTKKICDLIKKEKRNIPIIFSSSTQAKDHNLYGKSKLDAEKHLKDLSKSTSNNVTIYRLPGVFGKWCKPNYNSVVATFCHNIARNIGIDIQNNQKELQLVYIDDLANDIIDNLKKNKSGLNYGELSMIHSITLGDLANKIFSFKESRKSLVSEKVGTGVTRALYSTYISYLPVENFTYQIPNHGDERGHFVEILKTYDSGQFSFLTIKPGISRGNHYHHSKTEKFIILRGRAKLRFRHLISNEKHTIEISEDKIEIVDTIPGWVHDITNIGDEDVIMMLWANEIFDKENPDTITKDI